MYKPAPPRPNKTDNVRSRTGCQSCRARHTKCDEQKPTCGTCARLQRVCQSPKPQLKFRVVTTPLSKPGSSEMEVHDSKSLCPDLVAGYCHPPRSPVAGLTLVQSLQHTEWDVFYTTYCEDRCIPALHPVFCTALLYSSQSPMLKDAILALSSCNISRRSAEYKDSPSVDCLGAYRPSLVHQTRSHLYYSQAIKSFASLSYENCQKNLALSLTVVVIFAYIESSIGNLTGFDCHVRGLPIFLDVLHRETGDTFVKSLLTAWMQPRFVVWWSRAYYSSIEVQRQLPSVPLPANLQSSFGLPEERRVLVLQIMCESHRLNVKAVLKHWSSTNVLEGANSAHSGHNSETVFTLLNAEARKLDEWLSHLPASEQPFAKEPMENSDVTNSNPAIYFQSHDAALNYGYYVVARIMQCTDCLCRLPMRDSQVLGHECFAVEPWIRLLLRIAQGTDMQTSVMRNTYTIGFSSLLLAAFLRCQDLSLNSLIQNWLQALEDLTPTEEGSFPIFQGLSVVRAINRQRIMGRDVFAVSQSIDDEAGPKFNCYCSQKIDKLFVHGKFRSTGDFFTDCISIESQRVKEPL